MGEAGQHGQIRFIGTLLAAFSVTCFSPQGATAKPAVPLDPVDGIIAAFKTHRVVALGEGEHNNEQGHALRLKLIRDPRFAKAANDIVVEFGNSPQSSITYSTLTPDQCADRDYLQMRIGRMKINAGPNADSAGAELQESCAKILAVK